MIQAIEPLITNDIDDSPKPTKLTVELVGELFKQNYRIVDIANYTNQKGSNVSRFCTKHKAELEYIRDIQDRLAGNRFKRIMYHGQEHQLSILTDMKKSKKLSAPQTAVMTGIATQNYRLCADKSTHNVSMDVINSNIAERQKRREELLKELGECTGGDEVGNEAEIIDVDGEPTP